MGFSRRRFFGGVGGAALAAVGLGACAPKPSIDAARSTLQGLWDAVVPGTHHGRVEDADAAGTPIPGAGQAGVQEWFESILGTLPAPLDFMGDWFFRAWAADLDLWADTFHPPFEGAPTFGELPLGPSFAERGRQYKVMLMMKLFPGVIELKYLSALLLAKLAFYGDFRAETGGGPRIGGPLIGFGGPVTEPVTSFTFNRPAGRPDPRLATTAGGLVCAP